MTTSKTRILVVDDEDMVRTAIVAILEGMGYEIDEAEDGAQGFERATTTRPDLIICDVNMPRMDGFELLRKLQADPAVAAVPFLFLTGYSDHDHFRHGMTLGADDYLFKPITRDDLIAAVEKRLQKQAALMAATRQKMDELRASISLALPHELRTPLHGILGFCNLIVQDSKTLTPEDITDLATRIQKAAERLQRLIENFLIYAQLEVLAADHAQMEALRQVRTEEAGRIVEMAAKQKAQAYKRADDLRVQAEPVAIAMSDEYVTRIVDEMVDNALKFSSRGTPVSVTVRFVDGFCRIAITDRGRGITPEQQREVGAYMQFNRKMFEQQGSGLGLAIARRLAELHGGTLQIDSEAGRGTTVTLSIPSGSPAR